MTTAWTGQRAVVVGGNGAVGRLLVGLLQDAGARVLCVDVADAAPPRADAAFLRGDITARDEARDEAIGQADLVVLAVPEPVALAAVAELLPRMPPGALLVETLSVQRRIAAAVEAYADGREALGINPLFAPGLGLAGRPIALIPLAPGSRSDAFAALLNDAGAQTVAMTAAEHDHLTGALQAATHSAVIAFGQALCDWGVEIGTLRRLAPPPHAVLLLLLARIASGSPAVYWDIQAGNPDAAAARAALQRHLAQLSAQAQTGDERGFVEAFERLRTFLGDEREELATRCAQLFAALPLSAAAADCPPAGDDAASGPGPEADRADASPGSPRSRPAP